MEEVKIKDNPSNLQILINGYPKLSLIPKDEFDLLIAGLEIQMNDYFKKKRRKNNLSS